MRLDCAAADYFQFEQFYQARHLYDNYDISRL